MTETTTVTSNLVDLLNEANIQAEDPDCVAQARVDARQAATEYFLETLLTSPTACATMEAEMLARAKTSPNARTYRLSSWTGSGPTYQGQHLSELLDIGDLLQRMQDFLDENYRSGEGENEKRLRVFNCPASQARGRPQTRGRTNLIISWNKEKFSTADAIIEANRKAALERKDFYARRDQQRYEPEGEGEVEGEVEGEEAEAEPEVEAPAQPARKPNAGQGQRQGGQGGYHQGGQGGQGGYRNGPRQGQGQSKEGGQTRRPVAGGNTSSAQNRAPAQRPGRTQYDYE